MRRLLLSDSLILILWGAECAGGLAPSQPVHPRKYFTFMMCIIARVQVLSQCLAVGSMGQLGVSQHWPRQCSQGSPQPWIVGFFMASLSSSVCSGSNSLQSDVSAPLCVFELTKKIGNPEVFWVLETWRKTTWKNLMLITSSPVASPVGLRIYKELSQE